MNEPRPSVTQFVRAVARVEAERGGDALGVAPRIVKRLHDKLGKLVGGGGFDVLLARSLVLARRTHPVLAAVTAGRAGTLTGLDVAPPEDAAALQEGATAIASHFIELLVVLIGEDLAMELLRDVWPEATKEEAR